jgi:hypothetical protein
MLVVEEGQHEEQDWAQASYVLQLDAARLTCCCAALTTAHR